MNDLRKAAERLLEALEDGWVQRDDWVAFELRQALAQPEQEPVAWMSTVVNDSAFDKFRFAQSDMYPTPVYTAPPKREWVGLTDDELAESLDIGLGEYDLCLEIEDKLKEKNT